MTNNVVLGKLRLSILFAKIENNLKQIIASCSILFSVVNDLIDNSAKLPIDFFRNETERVFHELKVC